MTLRALRKIEAEMIELEGIMLRNNPQWSDECLKVFLGAGEPDASKF